MKKLLVMGSNFGAVEIVKRARERGIYTIVTDSLVQANSNAKKYSDECWNISTTETQILAQKCRRERIDAVTCGVSEFTSELTFRLCDELGLPKYCTWESWKIARDKRKFKDLCISHKVRVAKDYIISDPYDDKQINDVVFPVVVKPVDCGGNLGVSFCNNEEELKQAFIEARKVTAQRDNIICEQMLEGKEYVAFYALAEGEARLVNLFSMLVQDGEPGNIYSLDVTTSDVLDEYLAEIDEGIMKVFQSAGMTDGIAWIELMKDKDGKLYVLETGYRLPGGMLPYTYHEVAGFDAVDWYLDCFLGIKHTKEELPARQQTEYEKIGLSYLLWNREGGVIKQIQGIDEMDKDKRVMLVDFIRRPGYTLHPHSLMGEIIFVCESREDALQIIRKINDTVRVITTDNRNVLITYQSFYKLI